MMDRIDSIDGPFECVEPALGEQLGLLADPNLAADLHRRLDDHVTICDACRLELAVERQVSKGLANGQLNLMTHRKSARPAPRFLAWGGGLAMAASLALMFVLPPTAAGPNVLQRGDDDAPRFVRPVEGEVIASATPLLEWTPIKDATAYRLRLSEVGGGPVWSARVKTTSVRIPESFPLAESRHYQAILEPVPADLAGLADLNVNFRREGTASFLAYRVTAAPLVIRLLGAIGIAAFGFGLAGRFRRRGPRPA